jgi:hypothetical protein
VTLHTTGYWKLIYLSHFSKPSSDRLIYRTVHRQPPRRIVELGIGIGTRALRLIDIAARHVSREEIQYTGIDPFEDRVAKEGPGLPLIIAHRLLKRSGARIQLIPGNPFEGLIRSANLLGKVDLLIISNHYQQVQQLKRLWFYVPRLLHEKTIIFLETLAAEGEKAVQRIDHRDIHTWAVAYSRKAA